VWQKRRTCGPAFNPEIVSIHLRITVNTWHIIGSKLSFFHLSTPSSFICGIWIISTLQSTDRKFPEWNKNILICCLKESKHKKYKLFNYKSPTSAWIYPCFWLVVFKQNQMFSLQPNPYFSSSTWPAEQEKYKLFFLSPSVGHETADHGQFTPTTKINKKSTNSSFCWMGTADTRIKHSYLDTADTDFFWICPLNEDSAYLWMYSLKFVLTTIWRSAILPNISSSSFSNLKENKCSGDQLK